MQLDQELERALEVPFADDPAVRDGVQRVLAEVRTLRTDRRRRRVRLTVGLITVGMLGVGGVGTAVAASLQLPWDSPVSEPSSVATFSSGDICNTAFTVSGDFLGPGTYKEKVAAAAAGSAYLKTLDLASLEYFGALREASYSKTLLDAQNNTGKVPFITPEAMRLMFESRAVGTVVFDTVNARLSRLGFTAAVTVSGDAHCTASGSDE